MGNDDDAPHWSGMTLDFLSLSPPLMAVLAVIVWDRRMAVFDGSRPT